MVGWRFSEGKQSVMNRTPEEESLMAMALLASREAWNDLNVPAETFARFLSERRIDLNVVTTQIVQDLYLACACAHGIKGAISSFSARFRPLIVTIARRFDESPAFADEVQQHMNETLFVATEGHERKIGQYTGDGPLTGFVGTSARRTAMRMAASASRFQGEDALARQFSAVHDQETEMLKAHYGDLFNGAISIALRKLAPRDRLILRLNLIERVSTTKLATTYGVSQPTVSRWIQRAADQIFSTVKEMLCDELKIDTNDLHSLLALVRSQIDFTLSKSGTDDDAAGG